MSSLVQRLLDRGVAGVPSISGVLSTVPSVSPMAQFDQRLHGDRFPDLPGLPGFGASEEGGEAPAATFRPEPRPRPRTSDSIIDPASPPSEVANLPVAPIASRAEAEAVALAAKDSLTSDRKARRREPEEIGPKARPKARDRDVSSLIPPKPPSETPVETPPPPMTIAENGLPIAHPQASPQKASATSVEDAPATVFAPQPPQESAPSFMPTPVSPPAEPPADFPAKPPTPQDADVEHSEPATAVSASVLSQAVVPPRVDPLPPPAPPPTPAPERAERIVERVVREVPIPGEPRAAQSGSITAAGISKIGRLPDRQRAFTLFGRRRR